MMKCSSCTGEFAVDPRWPLCMFELRGKCNNEECLWQHLKGRVQRNTEQIHGSATSKIDDPVILSSTTAKFKDVHRSHDPYCDILSIPTYRIGSNLVKTSMRLSGSVLSGSNRPYWETGFCTSFSVPLPVQRILPTDAPVLQITEGPVVDYDNWNRLSSFVPSQNGMMELMQNLADSDQTLEVALYHLSENASVLDGKKKALPFLSRALEADPNSVELWVIYLHIYYRKEKAIGRDDMFSHAVQHNEDSYELWLMYINSRTQLVDRMNAYDHALSVFCDRAHSSDKEIKHISACVLDIFLQMIQFSCSSGDVDKAIMEIYGLSQFETDNEISGQTSFPHILSCLTLSDRYIFWICCIYVVVYRKLPEAIVQQFELEKDMSIEIEWPSINLAEVEKNRALELMRVALKTMALDTDGEIHGKDFLQKISVRSAHILVVSNIRCVLALQGSESTADMLAKYMKLYPTCTELVAISAQLRKVTDVDVGFEVFEEALRNFPKDIPGVQLLWHHYAKFALKNRNDFAEKLMLRWFQSLCEGQDPGRRELQDGELCTSSEFRSLTPDISSCPKGNDDMFTFLNLCIHRLLQENIVEARVAVDKALRLASPEDFKKCAKEHAAFILSSHSVSVKDISDAGTLGLLNIYLGDVRSSTILEPLSRRFLQNIKKPRVRQLINNLLGPVSLNCSLMNSILEVWFGPELLPEDFDETKMLVDYVEPLMEIMPANYQLALSVCKLVIRKFITAGSASVSVLFWASSLMVNAIFQTFPVAPEQVWLEATNILSYLEIQSVSEKFHQHALSVYPFSIDLWKSYFNLSKVIGNVPAIVAAARERGIELR